MSDIDDCLKSVRSLTRDRGEVMRAGNYKIEEIRARHQEGIRAGADADRAFLLAEVERLRASLKPFAQLYLWPDDLGEDMAALLRSEADWCEATNEDADSDVFIKRRYIRAAREALEAKP